MIEEQRLEEVKKYTFDGILGISLINQVKEAFGDAYCSVDLNPPLIKIHAHTQEQARGYRSSLPSAKWTREYNKSLAWWEWDTKIEGVMIKIYAIGDAPACCTPIYEKKTAIIKQAVEYEDVEVTQEILVGYDCGGADE